MAAPKKELLKKKKWFAIQADDLFNHASLGESYVEQPKDLVGKTLVINLMNLVGDAKRQNTWVKFEVTDVQDQKGQAKMIAYSISPSSIRRLVRRGRDRLDHSFLTVTKDGIFLRLKFLLVTRSNSTHVVLVALRKRAIQVAHLFCTSHTFKEVVTALVHGKLQEQIHMSLHKIYPLRTCEIRALYIDKKAKPSDLKLVVTREVKETPQTPGSESPAVTPVAATHVAEAPVHEPQKKVKKKVAVETVQETPEVPAASTDIVEETAQETSA